MKKITIILGIIFSVSSILFSQEGITFKIEELDPPDSIIKTMPFEDIYPRLIKDDKRKIEYSDNDIIAMSEAPSKLVNYGYHSFFQGMHTAYAEHRPFVLSPDMIWLLICQGFSRHVEANSEELRHYFIDFSGEMTLTVKNDLKNMDFGNN